MDSISSMLVTCAVIVRNRKMLLARRPLHKAQGGLWEFPGGKVHEGENPEDCIRREILEELHLAVEPLRRLDTIQHAYPSFRIELIPFLCAIQSGEILLAEHSECRWFSPDELNTIELCAADQKLLPQLRALVTPEDDSPRQT